MAISGSNFFGNYLADRTAFINKSALNILNDAHYWMVKEGEPPGLRPWILSDNQLSSISQEWSPPTSISSRSFTWSGSTKEPTNFLMPTSGWKTDSSVRVDLSVVQGKNMVTCAVSGKSARHESCSGMYVSSSKDYTIEFSFTITLTLNSVLNGALELTYSKRDPV